MNVGDHVRSTVGRRELVIRSLLGIGAQRFAVCQSVHALTEDSRAEVHMVDQLVAWDNPPGDIYGDQSTEVIELRQALQDIADLPAQSAGNAFGGVVVAMRDTARKALEQ